MIRQSYMDSLEREYRLSRRMPVRDEEVGVALERAIRDTQKKIDAAFTKKAKIKAKLKQA